MPITTPQDLRDHLDLAIRVELSTIPPYLYAMYSIADQESEAAQLIRSVVAEEMLHAALVANLILALGGQPDFTSADMLAGYPSDLRHHKPRLTLRLERCSRDLVDSLFLPIEQPEVHNSPATGDEYSSLGQFYHAIETGMKELASHHDLFSNPQVDRQMTDPSFYRPVAYDAADSGNLVAVDDLDSARAAIEVIVHQGEGLSDRRWADPGHQELTHYHKFLRISDGSAVIGAVTPVPTNPRTAHYPAEIRPVSDLFNAAYRYTYLNLGEIFEPEAKRSAVVGRLYTVMLSVLSPIARYLMELELGEEYAAPTFEVFDFENGQPLGSLRAMAAAVVGFHPALANVATELDRLATPNGPR